MLQSNGCRGLPEVKAAGISSWVCVCCGLLKEGGIYGATGSGLGRWLQCGGLLPELV